MTCVNTHILNMLTNRINTIILNVHGVANFSLYHICKYWGPNRFLFSQNSRLNMSTEKENGKVCLVLLEGIGINEEEERNAVKAANMEYLESLKQNENCLYYELKANGSEVVLVPFH